MKIAICSPIADAYSETFIHAHRDLLQGEVLFYNTGSIPHFLGDKPLVFNKYKIKSVYRILKQLIRFREIPIIVYIFFDSLKQNKPDVILAEYGPTAVAILPIVQLLRIPMVVHFHGYDATIREVIEQNKESYKNIFNYASSVISVSAVMSQRLIGLGCPENKIIQTCYGPNDDFFKLEPKYTESVFLAVGRFVEKKAPYFTILAFKEVLKEFPDAKLRMAGDGPLKSICQDIVRYLKIEESVVFLGVLSPKEIMEEMSKARTFVQHSKTAANGDMEGTPVGILEAQAAALPVVSTYHGGIPEVVLHEKTGFLVNENDVLGMANYMLRTLQLPDEAAKMGKEGRKRVKDYFTMKQHIETIQKTLINCVVNK